MVCFPPYFYFYSKIIMVGVDSSVVYELAKAFSTMFSICLAKRSRMSVPTSDFVSHSFNAFSLTLSYICISHSKCINFDIKSLNS